MGKLYLIFAACVFGIFCMLEWRGATTDSSKIGPAPRYYTYHGSSSGGGGVFFGSSRSSFSHK